MRFIITPFLWRGRVPAGTRLSHPPSVDFVSHGSVAQLRWGSEELSLGMMSLQVSRSRGRRGDGVSGSHGALLPAPSRR